MDRRSAREISLDEFLGKRVLSQDDDQAPDQRSLSARRPKFQRGPRHHAREAWPHDACPAMRAGHLHPGEPFMTTHGLPKLTAILNLLLCICGCSAKAPQQGWARRAVVIGTAGAVGLISVPMMSRADNGRVGEVRGWGMEGWLKSRRRQ